MADDMDRRRRTPVSGVRPVTASLLGQDWDEQPTPDLPTVTDAIVRRKEKVTSQQTLDRVASLRRELGARIDHLDSRVDGLAEIATRTAGTVDGIDGNVNLLAGLVKTSLEAQSEIRVARVTAAVEVEKTAEIALIDEAKERSAARWGLAIKVVAIVGPVVVTAATLLIARC